MRKQKTEREILTDRFFENYGQYYIHIIKILLKEIVKHTITITVYNYEFHLHDFFLLWYKSKVEIKTSYNI